MAGRKGAEEGLNPSCLTQIFCAAMPWVDCTRLRYHCTKLPDINLCPLVGVGCWVVRVGALSGVCAHAGPGVCWHEEMQSLSCCAAPAVGS